MRPRGRTFGRTWRRTERSVARPSARLCRSSPRIASAPFNYAAAQHRSPSDTRPTSSDETTMAQNQDTTPTPAEVAQNATQTTDANLRSLVLLGTFGPEGDLTALLRLTNGTTARVRTGDRIGGDRIVAVDDGRLALAENGRMHWIEMP
ncbi:MAG: pilus assembly protein PilP [Thalassococcus profundi]|nr:pilus assembly protein PilP [Thalassococcus profundi]